MKRIFVLYFTITTFFTETEASESNKGVFKLDDFTIDDYIHECRRQHEGSVFYCLTEKLKNIEVRYYEDSDSTRTSNLHLFNWLLSLPILHPNTVIYNQEPIEIKQENAYRRYGFVREPKFGPLFYRVPINEYHNLVNNREHRNTSKLRTLKDKIREFLGLGDVMIGYEHSYTVPYERLNAMFHGDVSKENLYTKLVLLHLDYKILIPLKRKSTILSFLNKCGFIFKCQFKRFYIYLLKRFKCCRIISDRKQLIHFYDISESFKNVSKSGLIFPFVPVPTLELSDDIRVPEDHLVWGTVNHKFSHCILSIVNTLSESIINTNDIFEHLDRYLRQIERSSDVKTLSQLDGFYILEVWPKSSGVSFINMFNREDRNKVWNSSFRLIVTSHICKLSWDLPLFRTIQLLLVSFCLSIAFFTSLIFHIVRI